MKRPFDATDTLAVNTLRTLAIDMVEKANSGHPGLPLGAAPMAYALWSRHLKFDPKAPDWADRDRFVLSAGHGSALLYSLLHTFGYALPMEELMRFRQWESKTPGHPEYGLTPGVEATTGPLGQGVANAVGMAMAERALASYFNREGHKIVDHFTYALVSEGDLMEGIAYEACSLAGHLGLGKLIFLFDFNQVTLDGPLSASFSEDITKRFQAMNWQVLEVEEGNTDLAGLDAALQEAKTETAKPSLIIVNTTIGYGSPNKCGKSSSHGSPLGAEELARTKKALGWEAEQPFTISLEAARRFAEVAEHGQSQQLEWQTRFATYEQVFPELAVQFEAARAGEMELDWEAILPTWEAGKGLATRSASGEVINAIAPHLPLLLGGDADLSGSTNTTIKGGGDFDGATGTGRNFHFGIREHAMAGIANGIAYHGGIRPFVATFFVFSDYMRPSVRLAALSHLPIIYVWTHDSIGVGEDGPTHEPVEHLAALRAMPNLSVVRPADATEVAQAWRYALERKTGPTALVLSRQKLPVLDREQLSSAEGLLRGAYVLSEAEGEPQAILIATGSEVEVALAAQTALAEEGIQARVVSMPCWEAFEAQDAAYQEEVLPKAVKARVAIEAGVSLGWQKWVGCEGALVTLDRFGASAPGETNMEQFGFTAANVVAKVKALLG